VPVAWLAECIHVAIQILSTLLTSILLWNTALYSGEPQQRAKEFFNNKKEE
jgi:hypothetical protein